MLLKSISILLLLITGIAMFPSEKKKKKNIREPSPPLPPPQEVRLILPYPLPHQVHFNEKRPPPQEHFNEKRPPPQEHFIEKRPLRQEHFIEKRPPPQEHFIEKRPPPQEQQSPSQVHFFGKRPPPPSVPYDDYAELRNYEFNYLIDDDYTNNYQTREETKDGDRVVGSYTVKEPTGALRVVKYVADQYGFRAMVRRLWPGQEKP